MYKQTFATLNKFTRKSWITLLGWWHLMSDGRPPDLIMFLVIDEFAKVINFAIAKPVRKNLWRGLSTEARYEAKPIVDTLANRWGGGRRQRGVPGLVHKRYHRPDGVGGREREHRRAIDMRLPAHTAIVHDNIDVVVRG